MLPHWWHVCLSQCGWKIFPFGWPTRSFNIHYSNNSANTVLYLPPHPRKPYNLLYGLVSTVHFLHCWSERHIISSSGLAAKNSLHVLLPKAEDCERVDEWRREQHRAREYKMGSKIQRHAIHTVTSGTLVKNHNPKKGMRKMKWKFELDVILYHVFFFLIVPHYSIPSVRSWSLFLFHLLSATLLLDPRRIRPIPPDNPRRDQKHNPFHLHFQEPSWKYGNKKTPESPVFPIFTRCPSAFHCKPKNMVGNSECQWESE